MSEDKGAALLLKNEMQSIGCRQLGFWLRVTAPSTGKGSTARTASIPWPHLKSRVTLHCGALRCDSVSVRTHCVRVQVWEHCSHHVRDALVRQKQFNVLHKVSAFSEEKNVFQPAEESSNAVWLLENVHIFSSTLGIQKPTCLMFRTKHLEISLNLGVH